MNTRSTGIQLGYVAGFSSLVAAVIYFYASNWPLLTRGERFVPLFLAILLLYGLSVYLSGKPGRQLVSRLSLLGSCISFGVGLAVIGQAYNSHADSYGLFAIWAVPALLFSLLSRWQPFYVLTYVLAHVAYWLYFIPSSGWVRHTELRLLAILGCLAALQGLLFLAAEKKLLRSPVLRFLSFILLIGLLLALSNTHLFEAYGLLFNLPLVLLLSGFLYYFRKNGDKMYFLWAGLSVSAAVIVKYSELAGHFFNEMFFVYSLVFVILFVAGNIGFLKMVQKAFPSQEQGAGDVDDAAAEKGRFGIWVAKVLTGSAVIAGTVLGTSSLLGLLYMVLELKRPEYVLMGGGLLFVIGMLLLKRVNPIVRYTLLGIGLALGAGTALFGDYRYVFWVFAGLTLYAFLTEKGWAKRTFFFSCSVVMVALLTMDLLENVEQTAGVMTILLLAVYVLGGRVAHPEIRLLLQRGGFTGFLASLFVLSFLGESVRYFTYNGIFFAAAVLSLVYSFRGSVRWMQRISFGFWMAFLVWKYYDLAWKLLHKSVSLALIGAVVLTAVYWYEKRSGFLDSLDKEEAEGPGRLRLWTASLLIVLQVVVMAVQIGQREWLLDRGTAVKLELAPRDPRSLLQGDYVELRYSIAEPRETGYGMPQLPYNEKVKVRLKPGTEGVYRYAGVLGEGEKLNPGEVAINGRWNGYNGFRFGIENYFIPEGSGLEVERRARFAEVKIGLNGDAILVGLLSE